jgi:hypothetical protein
VAEGRGPPGGTQQHPLLTLQQAQPPHQRLGTFFDSDIVHIYTVGFISIFFWSFLSSILPAAPQILMCRRMPWRRMQGLFALH